MGRVEPPPLPMAQCIKNPESECHGLAQVQILEHKIEQIVERMEKDYVENRESHKEFYRRLEFGERAQAVTQNQLAQILADTSEIKSSLALQNEEINSIQQKPAKRWESIVEKVIMLIVGAVFALVSTKIGL